MITFIIGFIFGILGGSLYYEYRFDKAVRECIETIKWCEDIFEELQCMEDNIKESEDKE